MYSRLGIRTFGPARTLAGNPGEMPRGVAVHTRDGPDP
jgi:hypothetical protein